MLKTSQYKIINLKNVCTIIGNVLVPKLWSCNEIFLKIIENINSNPTTTYLCKQYYKTKLKLYLWDTMWLCGLVHWGGDWIGITLLHEQRVSKDWKWITGTSLQLPGERRQLHHKMCTIPLHYNGFPHHLLHTPPPVACSPVNWLLHIHLGATPSLPCLNLPVHIHPHHLYKPYFWHPDDGMNKLFHNIREV